MEYNRQNNAQKQHSGNEYNMPKKRHVFCEKCNHRFTSKSAKPRCSECGSSKIIEEKESIPLRVRQDRERIESLEAEVSELREVVLAFMDRNDRQKAHMTAQITELKSFETKADKGIISVINEIKKLRARLPDAQQPVRKTPIDVSDYNRVGNPAPTMRT